MTDTVVFYWEDDAQLANKITEASGYRMGSFEIHSFPDGECSVRVMDEVKDQRIVVICTMTDINAKFLPLCYLCETLKDLGAQEVVLVAPYLAYMRQDKRFRPGEGITSKYFASLVSIMADKLITIDPHLHRIKDLSEVYSIPTKVLHTAPLIAKWISKNVENPVILGPDSESDQWVHEVSKSINAPHIVMEKIRHGDRSVEISIPQLDKYPEATPVLVDDIISSGGTMLQSISHLSDLHSKPPVCIGIHGLFAGDAYRRLDDSYARKIVTCNTIVHTTNEIDISELLIATLKA